MTTKTANSNRNLYKCRNAECGSNVFCCIESNERCSRYGPSPRWCHISSTEHYCNSCFEYFYRTRHKGWEIYTKWRQEYVLVAKEVNFRIFIEEMVLPFWLRCGDCHKWRKLFNLESFKYEYINNFTCKSVEIACKDNEDNIVNFLRDNEPMRHVYLKNAVYQSLSKHFSNNLTAMDSIQNPIIEETRLPDFMDLFECTKLGTFSLSGMHHFELKAFPEYLKHKTVYLAIRNTIITLWNANVKEPLTLDIIMGHLIVRGMFRIQLRPKVQRVLTYLTNRGYINYGFIDRSIVENQYQDSILVIGAGLSGLAAAFHLQNNGYKVVVMEQRSRCGGKYEDVTSEVDGRVLELSDHYVRGHLNNPIRIIAHQLDLQVGRYEDKTVRFTNEGRKMTTKELERVKFHVQKISEIKKNRNRTIDVKSNLMKKHILYSKAKSLNLSQDEIEAAMLTIGHEVENKYGTSSQNISYNNWNSLRKLNKYSGEDFYLNKGFSQIHRKFAEKLNVKYNRKVTRVQQENMCFEVHMEGSSSVEICNRVVVAVCPNDLTDIAFLPDFDRTKSNSIKMIGRGRTDKLIMRFEERFWSQKIADNNIFSVNPRGTENIRDFCTFQDITFTGDKLFTLCTYASNLDEHSVNECLTILSKLFAIECPSPVESFTSTNQSIPFPIVKSDLTLYKNLSRTYNNIHFIKQKNNQELSNSYMAGMKTAIQIIDLL